MTDTPDHIPELQLKLWLAKTPGERLYQAIQDNDAMLKALREAKKKMGLSWGDLDFVAEYLQKKAEKDAVKVDQ